MVSAADVAAQIVAALAVTEPELDTSVGQPVRKIIDAVSEPIAETQVDRHLFDHTFDVSAKTGADLDDFVLLFGMVRFAPARATGVVTLTRPSAATQDYPVPAATQVTTAGVLPGVFATVVPAVLATGQTSVDVPVQAVVGGTAGNLAAHTLTALASPVDGVGSVTNAAPTSGGTNAESDAALVDRFSKTVFRSLAGTQDMYLGVALEDTTPDNPNDGVATRAKVIGASSRWREQVQVDGSGNATSSIPAASAKYVYPGTQFLGTDIDAGAILTPGVHYSFDASVVPPLVHSLAGGLTNGGIYDLDFEYSSAASRNDPASGVTNRIDVWVDGERDVAASETLYFRTARLFVSASTSALYATSFVRQNTAGVHPTVGNYFVALAFGPVVTVPATITVAGVTYVQGTDYWVVHDDSAFGYAPGSLFGLEWLAGHAPADAVAIALAYTYNAIPRDVTDRLERWRLVATDAQVHAAKRVYLRLNLAIMFSLGFDQPQVVAALTDTLTQFLVGKDFDAPVQVSDLIQSAHNVDGVDNVRFLNSAEPTTGGGYAIERVSSAGVRISYVTSGTSPARATDLQLGDNEVPLLYGVQYVPKAANSFGSV